MLSLILPGAADAGWQRPVTVSPVGTQYSYGQDVNADGDGLVVWSAPLDGELGFGIYARTLDAAGDLGPVRQISATPAVGVPYTTAHHPTVRFGGDGTATIVWLETTYGSEACFAESGGEDPEDCEVDEYVRSLQIAADGSSSAIRDLHHHHAVYPAEGSFGGGGSYVAYGQPLITGGPADTLTVLWAEAGFGSECSAYGYSSFYADSDCEADVSIVWQRLAANGVPAGSPSEVFSTQTTGYGSGDPLVRMRAAAAADGAVTVAFGARINDEEAECWGGESAIHTLRIAADGSSSPAAQVDSGCGAVEPTLALDSSGGAVLAWAWQGAYSADEALYARVAADGSVGEPPSLLDEDGEGGIGGVDLSRGLAGSVVAVWSEDGAIRSRQIPPLGPPGEIGTVAESAAGGFLSSPRVAVSNDGSGAVVWEAAAHEGDYETAVQGVEIAADGTPGQVRVLQAPQRWDHGARIAAGAGGALMASWRLAVPGRNRIQAARLSAEAAVGNDDFADAEEVAPELPSFAAGSNEGAGREDGEPEHAGGPGSGSVWYSWTAEESGPVSVSTCTAGGLDSLLAVYSGETLASLELVASAHGEGGSPCAAGDSRVRFEAQEGTTYRIAVDGKDDSVGGFGLRIRARAAPSNDDFAAARGLGSGNATWHDTTVDASRESGEPEHAEESGGSSVWFSWTPADDGEAVVSVCGFSLRRPILAVYEGSDIGDLTEVGAAIGSEAEGCSSAEIRFQAEQGETYRIAVDGRGGSEGTFFVQVAQVPGNDDFADAEALSESLPTTEFASTMQAGREDGEPQIDGGPGGASVWYSWTPQQNGSAVASLCVHSSGGKPALLGVYTGTDLADLDEVAVGRGQGSQGGGCFGSLAEVGFDYVAGTTYRIAVDVVDGAYRSFTLGLEPLPANDGFASAQPLAPTIPQTVFGSNRHAGREDGEPQIDGGPGGASLWYSWTPQQSGSAVASLCVHSNGGKPALLGVYTGTDVADLDEVAASRGQSVQDGSCSVAKVHFDYAVETTYHFAVDAVDGARSSFNLNIGPVPGNDDFVDAEELSGSLPLSRTGSHQYASHESGELPHGAALGAGSVWYSWTAPISGPVTVSVCRQSSFGSVQLGVYTGQQVDSLSAVGVEAGSFLGCFGDTRAVRVNAEEGTEYRIAVDGTEPGTQYQLQLNGRPANDDFGDAEQIFAEPHFTRFGSNQGAGRQDDEPQIMGDPGGASVWYSWTPQESGRARIELCGFGELEPLLAVYAGDALGDLSTLAQAGPEPRQSCGAGATVEFDFVAETTYWIAVDGAGESEGQFELEAFGRPANDDFAAARQMPAALPWWESGDNTLATKEDGEPAPAGDPGGASVWYRWTPEDSGPVAVSVCGSGALEALVSVYTGTSFGDLTRIAGGDEGDECHEGRDAVRFTADPGTVYWIAVDGAGASQGHFTIELFGAPVNDDFAAAEMLDPALPNSRSGSDRGASREDGEPDHAGEPAATSVWYSWTPTTSEAVEIAVCGHEGLDPRLAVYTGTSLPDLEVVAEAAGAENSECDAGRSEVQLDVEADTVYWIAVDGKAGSEGAFELTLRTVGPQNDDFADAILIEEAHATVSGTTFGATSQPGEPSSWPPAEHTVWYRWTAPADGPVRLHTCATGGGPMDLRVFTGASLGTLTPVSVIAAEAQATCSIVGQSFFGGAPVLAFHANEGTTYSISVDSHFQISPLIERLPPGPFTLAVNTPANDLRAAAERVPAVGASLSRTNVGATVEPGEGEHADGPGGSSIWFRWFAPANGPVSIDTCGSGIDTLLGVYGPEGSGGGSAEEQYSDDPPPAPGGGGSAGEQYSDDPPPAPVEALAASDDSDDCGPGSAQSSVELEVEEGHEYLIAVDGKEGATGSVELALVFGTPDTTPPETNASTQTHWNTLELPFDAFLDEPESTLECRVGEAAFTACGGSGPLPAGEIQMPGEGVHTVEIREVDAAGNPDPTPATFEVTIDMTPPETTIVEGAEGLTRFLPAYVVESDEEVSWLECSLDDEAFHFCAKPLALPHDLADGEHSFRVRARDLAGNVDPTPAGRDFTLDRTAPTATVESGPEGILASGTAKFAFGADEPATFTCLLNGQHLSTCASPFELKGIGDGVHVFSVRPTDLAGNVGALAEWEFQVETKPPDTTITSGPSAYSSHDSPLIGFVSSESPSSFECALDEEEFEPCDNPLQLENLEDGSHTIQVRAVDAGGQPDPTPAELTWTVDTAPPETSITAGPSGPIHERLLPFSFASSEPTDALFQCALNGGEFGLCGGLKHNGQVGTHEFAVRAIDRAGNVDPTPATQSFEVVNENPVPSLELDRNAGPAPFELGAAVGGEDPDGDALSFVVWWGDGTSSSGKLPQAPLTHTYEEPGLYLVKLAVSDGFAVSHAVPELITVGPAEVLRADAGDDRIVTVGEQVAFDGSNSRPATSIDGYQWSFGDGGEAGGRHVTHVYSTPGTYEVELTVNGASEPDTDSATIKVVPPPPSPVEIFVHDDGEPLAGATVMVVLPSGASVKKHTGTDGLAQLGGLPDGTHRVQASALAGGYLPGSIEVDVVDGEGSDGAIELERGEIADVDLEATQMTPEEMEAAGIDLNDPDNQHVFEFVAHIGTSSVRGYINRRGMFGLDCGSLIGSTMGCTGTGGGFRYSMRSHWPRGADGPTVTSFAIPVRATFLKEFYRVDVTIQNLASSEFTLADGHARISVPAGMSLAPTAQPQSATLSVPDLAGQAKHDMHWILRGDVEGEYHLSVDYASTLEPFGEPVLIRGRTEEPIKVWGASAVKLTVDVDHAMREGFPFTVFVKLKNVADIPVYNASLELLREGRVGYIEQPRQRLDYSVPKVDPGATLTAGPFILVPHKTGFVDPSTSFIRKVAGEELDTTIVTHERSPTFSQTPRVVPKHLGHKIELDWEPVPGAEEYEIYRVPDRETSFGEEPVQYDEESATAGFVEPPLEGEEAFYAVSAIIDGRHTMVHPLVEAPPPPLPGEGEEDAYGVPKGECALTRVPLGPAEVLSSCFERKGDNLYEATSRVRVNGIDLFPQEARVLVDVQQQRIKIDRARVQVGNIVLYEGRIDWSPRATIRLGLPSGTKIRGVPVSGNLAIELEPTRARLEADAKLPAALGGVAGRLKLAATNEDGPRLDLFELEASGLSLAGRVGIDGVLLKYSRTPAGDRWEGGATLSIPRPGSPLRVHGRLAIVNGRFASASAEADGINQSIAYGVFLQRLRASIAVDPLSLGGGIGLSAGPQILGHEAISVDGDGKVTFGNPHVYEVSGRVKVVEAEIASGYLSYRTSGLVEFGGRLGIDKSGFKANVTADGWVDGLRAFNARGTGTFSVSRASFSAEGVVSSVGIAACRRGSGPDIGAGYHWGGDATFFASSCDIGPFEAARATAFGGADGGLRFRVGPDEPVAVFALRGGGAPPRVVMQGPDGTRIVTPADGRGIDEPRVMLAQSGRDDTTYVAVYSPPAGTWTVETLAGSAPVTEVRRARALPAPRVEATVEELGDEAVLRWQVRPIPGQRVHFVERTAHGGQVIASTDDATGTATFTPLVDDDASREIVAVVEQYGLPRANTTVERYVAPADAVAPGRPPAVDAETVSAGEAPLSAPRRGDRARRPAPPAHVRVRRRGGRVVVSWSAVSGAARYELRGRLSSGRRVRATRSGRRLVIARVRAGDGVVVRVRALGPDGSRSAPRRARLRAVR